MSPHTLLLGHHHLHCALASFPEQGTAPLGLFSADPNSIYDLGRSDIVNNKYNFLCCHDTPQCVELTCTGVDLHCIHLEKQNASLCWCPAQMAQALLLSSAPANRWYDRQDELFTLRRTCTSCSFLVTYKNSPKPGKQCQGAALILHLSIPAGLQTKQLRLLRNLM